MQAQVQSLPVGRPLAPRQGESRLKKVARAVWSALQVAGERRARREILALAASVQNGRPELAAQLRRAADNRWA